MTIKAMAAASGFANSAVATGAYTFGAPVPISFVQVNSATPSSPQTSVSVAYKTAQLAGDTNIVAVGWNDITSSAISVTDTSKNTYTLVVGPTRQTSQSQSIFVAKNVAAAAANANTVTASFDAAAKYPDVRILSYRGLDPVSPVEAAVGAGGSGTTSNSGSVTTTNANDLLFAANSVKTTTKSAGTGFTSRIITSPDSDIAEDRIVTAAGTYSATANISSGAWVMQLVALRGSGASQVVDTQAPSAPTQLVATAVAGNQINLTWTASMDNVGVTAYLIERCQGNGCTNFVQVNTSPSNSYSDPNLTSGATYNYQVRATDAAGNLSGYSNTYSATVGAAAFSLTPQVVALTFTQTQQFSGASGSVTWMVDGTAGGSASSGTVTSGGLYTPPASVGTHTVTATSSTQTASATVYITNYAGTFMRDVDKLRTGLNPNETVLTTSNVNSTQFGKLFSYSIDGVSDASPLYVPNVSIPGKGFHNVVFVATEHDSVYAFDADGRQTAPLWQDSFINPGAGITTMTPSSDIGDCCPSDMAGEAGITGSPVIDPSTGTLYVVAKTKEVSGGSTNFVHRLHALDITTGAEKFGGPIVIQASVSGSGDGSSGGQVSFNSLHENQRAALLLNNGVVYIAWGAHADKPPYHGWVMGYNAATLQQVMAYNTTPNASDGGIWQSGDGLSTDATGRIYFVTGNGTFDANSGGKDYGDSIGVINPNGTVADYFTPHDQSRMESLDLDMGSGGMLLLPDQSGSHPHEGISSGKNGTIYVVDRDNMGHYNSSNDNQIVQAIVNSFPGGTYGTGNFKAPVYFNGHVYFSADADNIKSFSISNGLLSLSPTSQTSLIPGYPGSTLSLSANGTANGILWVIERINTDQNGNGSVAPGILHAYNANNLATQLYNSNQASGGRDALDYVAKWSAPLIVNGKVFVASNTRLTAFGLLP